MKNQNLSRFARQCAMLCVGLLALTAEAVNCQGKAKGKIVDSGELDASQNFNAEGSTAQAKVDPKIVKGLEAAAAATEHTGTNLVFPSSTGTSFAVLLFPETAKVTKEDLGRGVDIGVIYVDSGNEELPAGYYYVKLSAQPVEAGGDAGTKPVYAITLTQAQPGSAREAGSGNATGRRQYRPIVLRKDVSKVTPDGSEMLDTSTLGADILAAVEQSIIKTTKSNVK
jgi:hypothetical protein